MRTALVVGAATCVLFAIGWIALASLTAFRETDPVVVGALFVVALALFVAAARRVSGPAQTGLVVATAATCVAGAAWVNTAAASASGRALDYWPLALLVFIGAIGLWSWRLGRD